MNKGRKKIIVELDNEIVSKSKEAAKQEDRKFNAYVERALKKALERGKDDDKE